jgi:ferredoxin
MTIKRVWIEEICISCGYSEANCPEVFKMEWDLDSSTVIKGVDYSGLEAKIKKAVEMCPVQAIKYEEDLPL